MILKLGKFCVGTFCWLIFGSKNPIFNVCYILSFLKSTFFIVFIAIVFRSCAYEPFYIPSGSMKDTLLIGDYIFVSKYPYGYSKHSLPFSMPIIPKRIFYAEPKKGDIVVFRPPKDSSNHYIKRLIGLPDDNVQVRHGVLYINGTSILRFECGSFFDYDNNVDIPRYCEETGDGKKYHTLDEISDSDTDNTHVYHVPKDHFFVMGDNRDNSRDSRFRDVGFIPKENLVGRGELILFSRDKNRKWYKSLRMDRFFTFLGDK